MNTFPERTPEESAHGSRLGENNLPPRQMRRKQAIEALHQLLEIPLKDGFRTDLLEHYLSFLISSPGRLPREQEQLVERGDIDSTIARWRNIRAECYGFFGTSFMQQLERLLCIDAAGTDANDPTALIAKNQERIRDAEIFMNDTRNLVRHFPTVEEQITRMISALRIVPKGVMMEILPCPVDTPLPDGKRAFVTCEDRAYIRIEMTRRAIEAMLDPKHPDFENLADEIRERVRVALHGSEI